MPRYNAYGQLDAQISDDGDVGFSKLNTRLRPDQLQPGEVMESSNGRMDIDGCWQTRKGIETFGPALSPSTAALRLLSTPVWKLYSATPVSTTLSGATRSATTVSVVTSGSHGFSDQTIIAVSGLTGTVDPNGNRLITVTAATTFTFTITGATGSETYPGVGSLGPAILSSNATVGVYGSCLFSNPSSSNDNYIILATNQNAQAIKLSTGVATTIDYPASYTLSAEVDMIQAFDLIFIFKDGVTALSWNGVLTGTPAFVRVSNGAYGATTYYDAAGNTTAVDGLATVTATAHGLSVGANLYVVDNGSSQLLESNGGFDYEYEITEVPTADSFRLNAHIPDVSAATVVYTKKVSSGQGFTYMPAPAWGKYHQRRLWVPYAYTMTGSSGASPTVTARNKKDELVASDILDYNNFDKISNQFRVTAGTADYLVSVEPFAEDNLLVFNRHSIHLISGISGSLADTSTKLITSEVGCLARRSVVQVGNEILFLSDNGVYAAAFGDLYNLRGAGVPLSEPINPTIARINSAAVTNATAVYFNNRYYLAVPLDSSTVNNTILIYNFLNKGWESIDTTGRSQWDIRNLIIGDTGGVSKLYVVSQTGAIHLLDERADGYDRLTLFPGIAAASYLIASTMETRQYTMGTMDRKKFTSFELHVESSPSEASDATISIDVENPDSVEQLTTVSGLLGSALAVSEDASLRGRIGNKRGYGSQIIFATTQGRPKLRAVKVSATLTNPTITQAS